MDAETGASSSASSEQHHFNKRGSTWSDEETRALLSIWGDKKIQEELDSSTRNSHVFVKIGKDLRAASNGRYRRTPEECRQRIKTLKKSYSSVKTSNKTSGQGRSNCKYYDELDEVLGSRPSVAPPKVRDTCRSVEVQSEDEPGSDDVEEESQSKEQQIPATVASLDETDGSKDLPTLKHTTREERKNADKKRKESTCTEQSGSNKKKATSKIKNESLMDLLKEQQKDFFEYENQRWQKEQHLEEQIRKENREHELRIFSMFAGVLQNQFSFLQPPSQGNQFSCPQPSSQGNQFSCPQPSSQGNQFSCPQPSSQGNQFSCPQPSSQGNLFSCPLPSSQVNQFSCPLPSSQGNQFSCRLPSSQGNQSTNQTQGNKPTKVQGNQTTRTKSNQQSAVSKPSKDVSYSKSQDSYQWDQPHCSSDFSTSSMSYLGLLNDEY